MDVDGNSKALGLNDSHCVGYLAEIQTTVLPVAPILTQLPTHVPASPRLAVKISEQYIADLHLRVERLLDIQD